MEAENTALRKLLQRVHQAITQLHGITRHLTLEGLAKEIAAMLKESRP